MRLFIISAFVLTTALASCNQGSSKEGKQSAQSGIESTSPKGPVHLDKAAYLTKVHNFEANPDWKFEGQRPAIIDFYADWCKPCKMVAPYLEELALKYDGQVDIFKVNIDEQQEIASFYRISSIPTFFFIDAQGRVMGELGYKDKAFFEQQIQSMLGQNTGSANNSN